jgi:hypothetical protein
LVDQHQILFPIKAIIPISKAIDLYEITVDTDHNFLITNQNLLVHNPIPIIVAGLPWVCGAQAIQFASAVGIASILGLIGVQMNKSRNRRNDYEKSFYFNANNNNPPTPGGNKKNNDDDPEKRKKQRPLTNKEARAQAEKMGFTEVKNAAKKYGKGLIFRRGNRFISPDRDCHKGGVWKLLDHKWNRVSTWNIDLTKIIGE